MENFRIDPRKQFSKKLARWTSIFWFVYMSWLSVLMMLEPTVAVYNVYMGVIATVVMIVNVWAYTKNSVYEKACFAMLDKAKIEIGLKNTLSAVSCNSDDEDPAQETEEEDIEEEETDEGADG